MTLEQLEAKFQVIMGDPTDPDYGKRWQETDDIKLAQGVMFLCPKCFAKNNGNVGTHMVMCWFRNRKVPDSLDPKPGRWNPSGTAMHNLTFVPPGAVSVLLTSGCKWHGFVEDGKVRDA